MSDRYQDRSPIIDRWAPDEVITLLRRVLVADDRAAYDRECAAVAVEFQRDTIAKLQGRHPGAAVDRFVWGLAVRYREYECIWRGALRADRQGAPWTWTEVHILKLALTPPTEAIKQNWRRHGCAGPDVDYLAALLRRPPSEITAAINKYGPAQGRTGFGFK